VCGAFVATIIAHIATVSCMIYCKYNTNFSVLVCGAFVATIIVHIATVSFAVSVYPTV